MEKEPGRHIYKRNKHVDVNTSNLMLYMRNKVISKSFGRPHFFKFGYIGAMGRF